jgi:hypothetical protein
VDFRIFIFIKYVRAEKDVAENVIKKVVLGDNKLGTLIFHIPY